MLAPHPSADRRDNDVFVQYESNVRSYARTFPGTSSTTRSVLSYGICAVVAISTFSPALDL